MGVCYNEVMTNPILRIKYDKLRRDVDEYRSGSNCAEELKDLYWEMGPRYTQVHIDEVAKYDLELAYKLLHQAWLIKD